MRFHFAGCDGPPRQMRGRHRWSLRQVIASATAGASALLLAACGATPPGAAGAPHPSALNIAMPVGSNPNWFAPIVPTTACATLTGGMGGGMNQYMPLLWVSRTDTINYGRSIASSVTPSQNDTVYTIRLKSSWHWSNGHPVTAQDVVYDWQLMNAASQPNAPFTYCFAGEGGLPALWQSVVAPNAHTVVVTTTKSVNPVWFIHNGLAQFIPIPKSVWAKHHNLTKELSWIKSIANKPMNPVYQVVDGAYRIEKAVPNQYYEFVANPRYSGHKAGISHVIYNYETSSAAEFAALKRGTNQIGYMPFGLYGVRGQLTRRYRISAQPQFGFFDITVNMASNALDVGPLFRQLYIRQALQDGINEPAIIQRLYHGLATNTRGPAPRANDAFYDQKLPALYSYSPARGKRLLTAHGWREVGGVMQRNGQRLAFPIMYPAGSPTLANVMQLLKQSWAAEGIDVTLQSLQSNAFAATVGSTASSNKWALAGGSEWIYVPDYYPTGGGLFATGAGFNLGQYASQQMNTLIRATYLGGSASTIQSRMDAYQFYAWQQLPVLYMPTPDLLNVVATDVGGWNHWYNMIISDPPINRLYWK